jgi:hypothetical protein
MNTVQSISSPGSHISKYFTCLLLLLFELHVSLTICNVTFKCGARKGLTMRDVYKTLTAKAIFLKVSY